MTYRLTPTLLGAVCALCFSQSAAAQDADAQPAAEERTAERVIPMRRTPQPLEPVYVSRPVIQGDPAPQPVAPHTAAPATTPYHTRPQAVGAPYAAPSNVAPATGSHSQSGRYYSRPPAGSPQLPPGAQLVRFDRQAWLDECRYRLSTHDEQDRGKIIGALAGTVIGGVVGNRVAGGDRLAGTLAGAGAGALAGGVIGDAIDDANRPPPSALDDECSAFLDDYMERARAGALSGQYVYGQQYMLIPVTVEIPQRAVYREVEAPAQ